MFRKAAKIILAHFDANTPMKYIDPPGPGAQAVVYGNVVAPLRFSYAGQAYVNDASVVTTPAVNVNNVQASLVPDVVPYAGVVGQYGGYDASIDNSEPLQ